MDGPLVSVIMGAFNCADTLEEAIEALQVQTYDNWELIICDDGSSDQTFLIAKRHENSIPHRIVVIQNEHNMGLNYTLNRCLRYARGTYIARMDGDDRCAADRIAKEVAFLENNTSFAIVSTEMVMFDEQGVWGRTKAIQFPQKEDFLHHSPFFCHAASMIRLEALRLVGGYTVNSRFLRVEDCNLWFKLYAAGYHGANILEPLYMMRDDRTAASRRKLSDRLRNCYVMINGFSLLKMPWYKYLQLIPHFFIEILKGLMPQSIYLYFHKHKYTTKNK